MPPRPEPDGGDKTIVVDVPSVEQAGKELDEIGRRMQTVSGSVRAKFEEGLGAFPPSDLFRAYAYCAGRWSRHLRDAADELRYAGDGTVRAAHTYHDVDQLPHGHPVPQ
jgi:hypothetical protein